jgi:hypothetical protein
MSTPETSNPDLDRVHRMPVVTERTSLSRDSIKRHYSHLLVKLSPRREGMTERNIMKIINGTAV